MSEEENEVEVLRSELGKVLGVREVLSREELLSLLLDLRLFRCRLRGLEVLNKIFLSLDLVSLLSWVTVEPKFLSGNLLGVRWKVLPSVDGVDFFRAPWFLSSVSDLELEDR